MSTRTTTISTSKRVAAPKRKLAERQSSANEVSRQDKNLQQESETCLKKPKTKKGEAAQRWSQLLNNQTTQLPTPDGSPTLALQPSPSSDLAAIRHKIAHDPNQSLTPFRRRILLLLTQVPHGQYTTYKALADAANSFAPADTPTCNARAVGGAMRNNPFAPDAPCHRVLASGGKIGGFAGEWNKSEEGEFVRMKRSMLRGEGVRFDGRGKVVGSSWVGFVEP